MKKHILFTICLICGLFTSNQILGQKIQLTTSADLVVDSTIDAKSVEAITQLLEQTINEYAAAASLLDTDKNQVTDASTRRFNAIFSPTASIMRDYAKETNCNLMAFKSYALEVYNLMPLQGIQMTVEGAELQEIKSDGLGFYTPVVFVKKRMFTSVDENGEVGSSFSGKLMEQKFIFDIYKDDLSSASISKIDFVVLPQKCRTGDVYNRVLSFSGSVGSSDFILDVAENYANTFGINSLKVEGDLNYAFGAEIMTDQFITRPTSSNRKLFASLGLRYASYNITSTLDSFAIRESSEYEVTATKEIFNNDYIRIVNPVNATEELQLNILEVPVGLSYNVLKTSKMLFNIHFRAIPSLALDSGGGVTGMGNYDGILFVNDPDSPINGELSQFQILRSGAANPALYEDENGFGPFRVGEELEINQDSKADMKLGFSGQISPTLYLSFNDDNPAWGVLVGIDLNYHFGYWLNQTPIKNLEDAALKFNDDYDTSLANIYLQNISGFSYALRVGVFNRLISNP